MFRGIVCSRRRGDSQSSIYYTGNNMIHVRTCKFLQPHPFARRSRSNLGPVVSRGQTKFYACSLEGRRARAKMWTRASRLSGQALSWDHVCYAESVAVLTVLQLTYDYEYYIRQFCKSEICIYTSHQILSPATRQPLRAEGTLTTDAKLQSIWRTSLHIAMYPTVCIFWAIVHRR